ncbi:MAG: flagellin [Verrucomicrobiota bacterium]
MIINASNSQASASLFSAARAPRQKAAADVPASPADQAVIASQNMVSAVSPLQDAGATRAALEAVRKQFIAQPSVALLAQAKELPQNALRLLQ